MPPPNQIYVNGHRYTVHTDAKTLREADGFHGHVRAAVDIDALKIVLDTDIPLSMQQESLLHEVLHILWHDSGVNEALPSNFEELKASEEFLVSTLSLHLWATLMDERNSELFEFLFADTTEEENDG